MRKGLSKPINVSVRQRAVSISYGGDYWVNRREGSLQAERHIRRQSRNSVKFLKKRANSSVILSKQ